MRFRKTLSLALVITMLLSTACGTGNAPTSSNSQNTATSSSENSALNPVGQLPIAKEKTELTILMKADPLVEDYDSNRITKMIEEQCNVDLKFEFLPATTPGDKLSIMISAGDKLPDIINFMLSDEEVYKYAQAGAIIPLNEYYQNCSANVVKIAEEYPDFSIMESITSPDGNIYAVPKLTKAYHDEVKYKYWINKKWLDKLGLPMPTTTEEFYNTLKAFKNDDPNGNGKKDEYPLVGGTGWSQDVTKNLMNAFVFEGEGDLFMVKDGKVTTSYLQPEWREGLRYMNKLVSEGLMDPISFTQDDAQLRAMVDNKEECIVGAFAFSSITLMNVNENPWLADYVTLPPLKGPEGVQLASYTQTIPRQQWFVTADCKNPELAFRVGDYLFNEDLLLDARFGEENVDWRLPKSDEPCTMAELGFESTHVELNNIWSINQNKHWRIDHPVFAFKTMQGGIVNPEPTHYANRIGEAILAYTKCIPQQGTYIPKIAYTEEEMREINDIRTTLKTYVKESKARFITGDLNLDTHWDTFQSELKKIGIDKFLEVSQVAYDRMYK